MKRLLFQHTSRGAVFDRYATIRNFFRQQHHSAVSTLSHSTSASFAARSFSHHVIGTRVVIRHFSVGPPLRQEKPPELSHQQDKSSEIDQGSQPRKESIEHVNLDSYPRFFRRLAMSLPHLQRPTRDDFLRAADGFWQRARIRFRWLTIRSFRRYNADEIGAFFTWFLMSQTLWLFVGT